MQAATLLAATALFASASAAAAAPLRRDGVPVVRPPAGHLRREHERLLCDGSPFQEFSKQYVAAAKKDPKNWMLAVHDHSLSGPGFGAGVKASVATLPPGFVHETA